VLLGSIVTGEAGDEFVAVGSITAPVVLEGGDDGAPVDPSIISVALIPSAGTHLTLRYQLDAAWLHAKGRLFPVIIDPTACLGEGVSGCDLEGTGYNRTHFLMSGLPNTYPANWTVFRVGYDVRSNDNYVMDKMRGLVYFEDVSLPDGAVISDTDLQLHVSSEYGGPDGDQLDLYRANKSWGQTTTWNQFTSSDTKTGYNTTGTVHQTIPASGYMHFDPDAIVQAWYTRRGPDWRKDIGFVVRKTTESGSEVEFDPYTDPTPGYRPKLTITYQLTYVGIDFAAALGPAYAPATMIAAQATHLPIQITNNGIDSTFDFSTSDYRVGYRWFDQQGALVGSPVTQALSSCVGQGSGCHNPSDPIDLAITPPSTPGAYTLRLDLVRVGSTTSVFASDYARPSKYYSRDKHILTSDNTRWTGSSIIERDEFSITVVARGGAPGGETRRVLLGDGGTLALNLWSHDLSYTGAGGIGVADRLPLGLAYGYDADVTDCTGILGACGWWTNWDERLIASPDLTVGNYTYQDPSGDRYLVDSDGDGQLISGAGVRLARQRVTLWDEAGSLPSGTTAASLVTAASEGIAAFSGANVLKVAANTSVVVTPKDSADYDLNTFRYARFGLRSSSAASSAVCFKVHNLSDSDVVDDWFCYTVGSAWTSGDDQIALGQTINGGAWAYYNRDLWVDVRDDGDFGSSLDHYQIVDVEVRRSASGNSGSIYLDGWRAETGTTTKIADANLGWTNGATTTSSDHAVGSLALKVATASLAASPDCLNTGCTTTNGLYGYRFVHWSWKKVGGQSAAVVVHLKDKRTNATGDITYYAGPVAPPGAAHPIQVSAVVPAGWTQVTRNVLEDGRQVLNFFNDLSVGIDPSDPPSQGPTPDDLDTTGFGVWGVDGDFLLIDDYAYASVPDAGAAGAGHPNATADAVFTADFTATYRDGTVHAFNADGLLERISDRDGNALDLDWTITRNVAGQAAYRLATIRGPADGASSAYVPATRAPSPKSATTRTFQRQIGVTYAGSSPVTVTFTERLGTTAHAVTGRSTIFSVATATSSTANAKHAIGDVIAIKPAREPGSSCGSHPNGCAEFSYIDTSAHQLQYVSDPRWDGSTSGASDFRFGIVWSGTDPTEIGDRSHGGAPLLRVLDYAKTGTITPAAQRVLWQDAAALRAGVARYTDLTSDGRLLYDYLPLACTGSPLNCVTNPPGAPASTKVMRANEFDGLAHINAAVTYRCPGVTYDGCTGTTAERVVARQATKAGAKVDNYADALVAGELAWSQSADQYFASLKDSGGSEPDLYRTSYAYDEYGRQTAVTSPAWNARADYPATITGLVATNANLKGYWRLTETSGSTATDAAPTAHNGTYQNSPALGDDGPLLNDAATQAPTFDGTNDYVSIPSSYGSQSGSFSVAGWINPASMATTMAIIGSRKSTSSGEDHSFDLKVRIDPDTKVPTLYADIGDGTNWLLSAFSGRITDYQVDRWYHVALSVDDPANVATLYLDGVPLARATLPSGTPLVADTTRLLKIGNNGRASATPEWWHGQIGEVAIWSQALTSAQVALQYQAGRAFVLHTVNTLFDTRWHPTQSDDQALRSPGFESGLADWDGTGSTSTASVHSGYNAYSTGQTGSRSQVVPLVAGQTFRVQAWKRSSGAAKPRLKVDYWKRSSGAWTSLVDETYAASGWNSVAKDLVLPFDTDGRVRVTLTVANAGGADAAYFDDVALLTTYASTTYTLDTVHPWLSGLVDTAATFAPSGSGTAVISASQAYAADTSSTEAAHPAIWPTKVIANWVNGAFDAAKPAEDVASSTTYDGWGRPLVSTDPDGVTATSAYVAGSSTNGDRSDVASTTDGAGVTTGFTYDRVGNRLTVTTPSPLSEVTTTTYDLRDQPLTLTAADGVVSKAVYDDQGFRTSAIANYVNGTPSGAGGLDDLTSAFTYDALGRLTRTKADTGASGLLEAWTDTSYDLAGNAVATTAYAGASGTSGRTTTSYWETLTLGSTTYARPAPTGTQAAIAPSASPAPACPDTTGGTIRCNAAALMPGPTGSSVSGLDLEGRTVGVTDAYGTVRRTFHDLAGRTVFAIADYDDGVYDPAEPDTDIVAATQYAINGQVATTISVRRYSGESADPKTVTAYDALGRPVAVTTYDTAGTAVSVVRTVYRASGRVDRASAPGAANAADAALTWTRLVYDRAGRVVRSIAHADISGNAQLAADNFEDGGISAAETLAAADARVWTNGTKGVFTAAGGSATVQTGTSSPTSGENRLAVTTGTGTNTGAEWSQVGKFRKSHTYGATAWVNVPSGTTLNLYLGTATDSATASVAGSGAWVALTVSWTPSGDRTGVKLAARRNAAAAAATFYLDDVVVWDASSSATNPLGPDTNVPSETVYDVDGRVVRSIVIGGLPGDPALVTRTTYDAVGRPTAIVVNDIAGGGNGDTTSNLTSSMTFDALGRATDRYDPTSTRTHTDFDRLGRTSATILDYVNGTPSGPAGTDDLKSTFAYDTLGEQIGYCTAVQVQVIGCDPSSGSNAQAWHYTYDALGRMATQVPPVNATATALDTRAWTYETGGRLASVIDRTAGGTVGRHTDTTYDALGRPTLDKTYQGSGTGTLKLQTTTTYLGDGQRSVVAFDGSGSSEGTDTLTVTYDAAGRPDQLKRGATVLSDLAWNANGTLASRVDGDAGAIGTMSFAYDWAQRLATTTLPSGWQTSGAKATQTYRLDGLLASRSWNGGSTATFAYDAAKRPTTLAKGSLLSLSQAYDRDGNVTSEGRSFSGISGDAGTGTQSFSYDPLNRVTGSSGLAAGSVTYSYDLDGNRLTKVEGGSTFTSTYDRSDELVNVIKSGGSTQSFAYDVYGNQTGDAESGLSVAQFSYDLGDRLTAVTPLSGTSATFTIDALGRAKTRALSAGGTDTYSYEGASETVLRIANSGGTTIDSVVDAAGQRLGVKVGSTVNWLTPDLHGNVASGLDQAETTLSDALRYDAYGQTLATYPGGGTTVSANWKYQGRLDVAPSGPPLYDAGARFYSPGLGAFTQLDSLIGSAQDPLSLNRFLYAEANPATLIDPSGHEVGGCGPFSGGPTACGAEKLATPTLITPPSTPTSTSSTTPPVADVPGDTMSLANQRELTSWYRLRCSAGSLDSCDIADAINPDPPVDPVTVLLVLLAVGGGAALTGAACVLGGCEAVAGSVAAGGGALVTLLRTGSLLATCAATVSACQKVTAFINSINAGLSGEATAPVSYAEHAVTDATSRVLSRGPAFIENMLSPAQRLAAEANKNLYPLFRGFRFHQAVAAEVERLTAGRVTYSYRGVDFLDVIDRVRVELTTVADLAAHKRRYGVPNDLLRYVTYLPWWP
jgi:RHS repeat-associated protein